MTTTLRTAIDRLLPDETLEAFVSGRREQRVSWRRIGVELYDATGIDISYETLRSWFPDEPAEAAS